MASEVDALRCGDCGGAAVTVEATRASGCLPFPPVEALRCRDCGNTGTRLRLRDRTVVQWTRGG